MSRPLRRRSERVARPRHRQAAPGPAAPNVHVLRLGGDALHRSALAPEAAADDPRLRPIVVGQLGMSSRHVLVSRCVILSEDGRLAHNWKPCIWPRSLPCASPGGRCRCRRSSTARRPRRWCLVAEAVAMIDVASEHVRDGLDARWGCHGKPPVVGRAVAPEIIEQEERVDFARVAEAEGTAKRTPAPRGRAGTW